MGCPAWLLPWEPWIHLGGTAWEHLLGVTELLLVVPWDQWIHSSVAAWEHLSGVVQPLPACAALGSVDPFEWYSPGNTCRESQSFRCPGQGAVAERWLKGAGLDDSRKGHSGLAGTTTSLPKQHSRSQGYLRLRGCACRRRARHCQEQPLGGGSVG